MLGAILQNLQGSVAGDEDEDDMAERVYWPINQPFTFPFWVRNGSTPVTGLTAASFSVYLSRNDTSSAVTTTITESSASLLPGRYTMGWTPNATGVWEGAVFHPVYKPSGFRGSIQVGGNAAVDSFVRQGTCQGGSSSTAILDAGAPSTTNFLKDCVVFITAGTGAGQGRLIVSQSSVTVTVSPNWIVAPDNTSVFEVYNTSSLAPNDLLDYPGAIDGETLRHALQWIAAAAAGNVSGAGTSLAVFLGLDGLTQRLRSACDDDGNRTVGLF